MKIRNVGAAALTAALVFTAAPAADALTVVTPSPTGTATPKDGDPPLDGTDASEAFVYEKSAQGPHGDEMPLSGCKIIVGGRDYGRYVVLDWIRFRAADTRLDNVPVTLRVRVRSASGSTLRDVSTLHAEGAYWSAGAPAGSIGDGGNVVGFATWAGRSIDCTVVTYTANY